MSDIRGRQEGRGPAADLNSQFKSVEDLLGSKRAELTTRLQRLRFGQEVTLELASGERCHGLLRGCNGVKVVLIDGTAIPVAQIRSLTVHERGAAEAADS